MTHQLLKVSNFDKLDDRTLQTPSEQIRAPGQSAL
jgi:hypothetical protein